MDAGGQSESLLARYSAFLVNYPGTTLFFTAVASTLLPITILFLNPLKVMQNPEAVSFYSVLLAATLVAKLFAGTRRDSGR